jgi:hypothetical protein
MSNVVQIIVGPVGSVPALAEEVAGLMHLGRPWEVQETPFPRVSINAPERHVWLVFLPTYLLADPTFGDVPDWLAPERYDAYIDVGAIRDRPWPEHEQLRDRFVAELFDALKAAGRYRLYLVSNVQEPLKEYDPFVDAGQPPL